MLEPVANIKTLLIEESCLSKNQCQQLKSSMGDIMISLIHTMILFLNLFSDLMASIEA